MKPPSARLARFLMNLAPCIRASGGRIVALSDDFKHLRVRLKLNLLTRNLVGTIYGGSLYSSIDPFYMLMLMRILGPDYVVWDKSATIRFKRPGKGAVAVNFRLGAEQIDAIRRELESSHKTEPVFIAHVKDNEGHVIAEVEKQIYIRKKGTKAA